MSPLKLCAICHGLRKLAINDWNPKMGVCVQIIDCPSCQSTGINPIRVLSGEKLEMILARISIENRNTSLVIA